jgi:hypothetical protein
MGGRGEATVPRRDGAIIRGNPESAPNRLVGRERELGALARALDGAESGRTAFVELAGEPGSARRDCSPSWPPTRSGAGTPC